MRHSVTGKLRCVAVTGSCDAGDGRSAPTFVTSLVCYTPARSATRSAFAALPLRRDSLRQWRLACLAEARRSRALSAVGYLRAVRFGAGGFGTAGAERSDGPRFPRTTWGANFCEMARRTGRFPQLGHPGLSARET